MTETKTSEFEEDVKLLTEAFMRFYERRLKKETEGKKKSGTTVRSDKVLSGS